MPAKATVKKSASAEKSVSKTPSRKTLVSVKPSPEKKKDAKSVVPVATKTPTARISPAVTKTFTSKTSLPAPKVPAIKIPQPKTPTTMEELLAMAQHDLRVPKQGDILDGIVTGISKKTLLVDISGKTEGVVENREFEMAKDYIKTLKPGDTVQAFVLSVENDRGQVLLSFRRAMTNQKWDQFDQALKTDEVLTVQGLELNKGGMIVNTDGIRGFIPTSQFGKQYIGKLESLLHRPIRVKVIEVDKGNNRLIFSERHVSEAQLIAQKSAVMDTIEVGGIYEGSVSGVMPFGVFVTVEVLLKGEKVPGKIEGLVHISEISWEKVEDPKQYKKVGEKVKIKVLSLDKDSGRLNLSIKQLSDDPWVTVAEKFPEGSTSTGTVSRVAPFGIFVNLDAGIDGLIHISKIPVGKEPKVGETIEVSIEQVEPEARRIRLGVLLKEVPMGYK